MSAEHLPCCEGCPGWDHFNLYASSEGIERCDECALYLDDEAAAKAHDTHCSCGMGVDKRAQRCHYCSGYRKALEGSGAHLVVTNDDRIICTSCLEDRPEKGTS